MKHITDWNKVRDEAHEMSKIHGFWEKPRHSREHFLCLVVSELMEAVEADRKNRYAKIPSDPTDTVFDRRTFHPDNVYFKDNFEKHVKDTVEDELADAIIRILDLAGDCGVNLNGYYNPNRNVVSRVNTFTENVFAIVRDIASYRFTISEKLNYARVEICKLAEMMGIDLAAHIRYKMAYNRTRGFMHGKKY